MGMNFIVLRHNKRAANLFQSFGAVDLTIREGWHYYGIPRQGMEQLSKPLTNHQLSF